MTTPPSTGPAKASPTAKAASIALPPDTAILIEARIKAGAPTLQFKAITNLFLHDPVLTLDVLQHANSLLFAGAAVTEIEAAISRLGTEKLITLLGKLNEQSRFEGEMLQILEVLRYNCRRTSIVALIVGTALRPSLASSARVSGLFADVGHMLALAHLREKYCELAKTVKRKALAFRLQKDLNFDINAMLVNYLTAKGMPKALIAAYDSQAETKGASEADLRFIVQTALELVDAYDSEKFAAYMPDKALPAKSVLRLLKLTPMQHERVYKATQTYLKSTAAEEAPEGAGLLISSPDEGETPVTETTGPDAIPIPVYQNLSVQPKSRDALHDFFSLCDQEQDPETLKRKAIEHLYSQKLFSRLAIVVVSPKDEFAVLRYSCGLGKQPGEKISVADPLSPFRAFRVEIRCANVSAESTKAPFGVSAFALGPLEILPSGEKVLFYADMAGTDLLSLEARRVFRLTMGLLMQTLQGLRKRAI